MGTLTKQVLGRVSGKVGDVLFRQRDGKNIVGVNPVSFMPGTDPQSIERRNKFALCSKFSVSVNRITELNFFWKNVTPEGLIPSNYIFRKNYPYAQPDSISQSAVIVPDYGFSVTTSSVTIDPSSIDLQLNSIGTANQIDPLVEVNCRLVLVLSLTSPTTEILHPYSFISLVSSVTALDLVNPISFTITPDSSVVKQISDYQSYFAYFSLITLDSDNLPVHYSSTFTS